MSDALDDVTSERLEPSYVQQRVDDWAERVDALYGQIAAWLPREWSVDRSRTVLMNEEMMRKYQVSERRLPVLDIVKENGSPVTIEPVGLWTIGANGRLDLAGERGRFVIVDRAQSFETPSWYVAPTADRRDMEPLSRDAFLKVT